MRRLALFVAVLLLAGCVTESASQVGGDYPKMDQAGNVYPEQCKGPITVTSGNLYHLSGKTIGVYFVPKVELPKGYLGANYSGLTYIDQNIDGWRRDDIVRHELCHTIAGAWHQNSEILAR